jgi:hypothetical protein
MAPIRCIVSVRVPVTYVGTLIFVMSGRLSFHQQVGQGLLGERFLATLYAASAFQHVLDDKVVEYISTVYSASSELLTE